MTLNTFMLAFRRVVRRKGHPSAVYSDNAHTYVSAECQILREMNIHTNLKSIPRTAQWYNGLWKTLIDMTKTTFKKVLGRSQLNADTKSSCGY